MNYDTSNPLIIQSDRAILLEVDNPRYGEARDALAVFAELEKSPEHIHTYRITPLSVWNACAAGHAAEAIVEALVSFSKYPPPEHVLTEVHDFALRYGRLVLESADEGWLRLVSEDLALCEELVRHKDAAELLERTGPGCFRVRPLFRGRLKQVLIKFGYPVDDRAGYCDGAGLELKLRQKMRSGGLFAPRRYQTDAAEAFCAAGSGVVVLPCGAGKTIVGMDCINRRQASTLILATNVTAVRQWIDEILDKTTIREDQIGEYSGRRKDIRPITVTTYQILTHRADRDAPFKHLGLFDERDWGLVIYDEVHMLPAPIFQVTASIQARRRLGLTATLVREDGHEDDVFALIGPKRYDVPWKILEREGWIAKARCEEIRVTMDSSLRMEYAVASKRSKFRIASENPRKLELVQRLLKRHAGERILILGMYVDQLKGLAKELGVPVLTGSTGQARRDAVFDDFRAGRSKVLVCSKIANFSVDLPDAAVAIQVSGTFGSRQEEAQRLGRILRPKPGANQAHFYSLVSHETTEQEFAMNRQLFLCEQGYEYHISHDGEL
ncbi:MAG: DEAD/DEAH box helicase [Pontiellaceae bacterium]|nr:DEAD/DEAH box helicase [Pontiellaceae bacterium]